jgi:D-alanyl-lipoteichoic acid acyltransferase DltB (MBOAT superfamily)
VLNAAALDLAAPSFWIFVAVTALCLGIAQRVGMYRVALALANGAFCLLITNWRQAALLALGLVFVHGATYFSARGLRTVSLIIVGATLAALFLVHKLVMPSLPGMPELKGVLAAIGFSYVALRGAELVRASAEGRISGGTLIDTVNYLIPFHMLAAGPIQAYDEFRKHKSGPLSLDRDSVLSASERIAGGLFKKFVLANILQTLFLTDFKAGGGYFFFEVQVYYLWIYLDFSAYTDIAIGVGRLLGVSTPENFNNPLLARNIIAFWERWHISLSQFIRKNIFIPIQLAGMRWTSGRFPLLMATGAFVTAFLLCGLWHGISWRFLIWGGIHATGLVICNLYRHALTLRLGRKGVAAYMESRLGRCVSTLVTFEFVAFSLTFIAHPATAFLG